MDAKTNHFVACAEKSSFHLSYLFQTRAFLFAAGFSLSFGAMFTKTYRVYQIFTRAHSGLVKSKVGTLTFAAAPPREL